MENVSVCYINHRSDSFYQLEKHFLRKKHIFAFTCSSNEPWNKVEINGNIEISSFSAKVFIIVFMDTRRIKLLNTNFWYVLELR